MSFAHVARVVFSQGLFESVRKMFPVEQVLEEPLWEALWNCKCVPEILQVRVTAQKWNDSSRCGLHLEWFILMRHESGDELDREAPTRDCLEHGRGLH